MPSPHYFGSMNPTRHTLAIAATLLCIPAVAQITISQTDMPSAGDTVRYRTTTTTLAAAPTGTDFLWDFSALVAGLEQADTMVSVSSTPLAYQFFFNNALLYPQHKADFAMRGPSIGFQQFSLSNLFDYYKNNSSGYRNVGFGANVNGLPTSVRRDPVDWIYRFPLNFGDVDSSASHFQVSVPLLGFFGQDQMRRNEVDGWGTLILPADTFQVLRVKSRINRTDTVHIDQFNIGFALPEPETIEYKWLAQGMDEPVLQINVVGGVNTLVRFYYDPEDFPTGTSGAPTAAMPRVWPNPASDVLHLERWQGRVELTTLDGRVVRSLDAVMPAGSTMDLRDLAGGSYLLRGITQGAVQQVVITR